METALYSPKIADVRSALTAPRATASEYIPTQRDLAVRPALLREPPIDIVPRFAAVMILLYPDQHNLRFPLTVRSMELSRHRGEVALPGGIRDVCDRSLEETALREMSEEIGVVSPQIEILGRLSPLYMSHSNFFVTPIVGYMPTCPVFHPNPAEVSAVFSVSLSMLAEPGTIQEEDVMVHGRMLRVPYFRFDGYKVWGMTANVLGELATLTRAVL